MIKELCWNADSTILCLWLEEREPATAMEEREPATVMEERGSATVMEEREPLSWRRGGQLLS